jgi:3-isopropylmalate dehydrogenase
MPPAVEVLDAVGDRFGHVFHHVELEAGGLAIDHTGEPLPAAVLEAAGNCDAVLLGAVGGPAWDTLPGALRPERALLGLRAGLGVYANLRPAALLPQLRSACPLKDQVLQAAHPEGKPGFDLLIVRELIGGLYFGQRGRSDDGNSAFDTERYSRPEIERILRVGYAAAAARRGKLCLVDKANVLESSRLWRETARDLAGEYPGVETSYMYVDNCAMQLVRAPGRFDVIVTSNLFGDILSDEASALTGSIGMLASASLAGPPGGASAGRPYPMGLYEPIHGSAPDIAGTGTANPLGMILSAALMLRYSFGLEEEARAVESAVGAVLDAGYRTRDIAGLTDPGGSVPERPADTGVMAGAVLRALENPEEVLCAAIP